MFFSWEDTYPWFFIINMYMQRRFIVLIILIIFIISLTTFFSVIFYVDPYERVFLALFSLITSFLLWFSTFLALVLYFIKKIYYRGSVFTYHVYTSLRQAFFLGCLVIFYGILQFYKIPPLIPLLLSLCIFIFLELFIKNMEK